MEKEKKVELECEYCGVPITEKDHKCPNCGASCTSTIKKFKQQQEKKEEEEKEKLIERSQKIQKDMEKTFVLPVAIIFILFVLFIVMMATISSRHVDHEQVNDDEVVYPEKTKKEKVRAGYNELATTDYYTIILDEYEYYSYTSDYFPDIYNTPDGYQKIAFHFTLVNTSDEEVDTYFSTSGDQAEVELKADGVVLEEANLEVGMHEKVVTGKSSYPKFNNQRVKSEDTLKGYVGFLVPKDVKELSFTVGPNVFITMDNPAYEGE